MININQKRLRQLLPALAVLVFSAILMTFCTATSPLYIWHDWTDVNTYLTMGRGMIRGMVPYRDLFDHKGPLLYGIYALGALMDPDGFRGVFLLQILSITCTLYFVYRTCRYLLRDELRALLCAFFVPLFLLMDRVYYLSDELDYGGGSSEEFCLPFFAAAIWLLTYCEETQSLSRRALLIFGVLTGAVFQIKFNLILFFVGLLLPVFLLLLRKKGPEVFLADALWTAVGFGLSLIPYLLYGLATRSLGDFIQVYILFNHSYAQAGEHGLLQPLISLLYWFRRYPSILGPVVVSCIAPLVLLRKRVSLCWRVSMLSGFSAMFYGIFMGKVFGYSQIPLMLAVGLGAAALLAQLPKCSMSLGKRAALGVCLSAVLLEGAVLREGLLFHKPLFWLEESTCQEEVAERIRSGPYEHPTLLEAGMLNRGFYNVLGLVPTERYFYLPNISYDRYPAVIDSQLETIEEERVDYVVLQRRQEEPSAEQARLWQATSDHYMFLELVPGSGATQGCDYYIFIRK